jgi:hypothetical protein
LEQIIIALIIVVIGFGLLRYAAKLIAWGLIIFVGIPFLFSDVVVDIDWSRLKDRVQAFGGRVLDLEVRKAGSTQDVEASLTYAPGLCSSARPLRLEMANNGARRVGKVDYNLTHRPMDRSTTTIFTEGTSDLIIEAGSKVAYCVLMPSNARRDDVFTAELSNIHHM